MTQNGAMEGLKHYLVPDFEKVWDRKLILAAMGQGVGTGNMAGVAVALTAGGPGAIFWMWLIAMLGMATSFAESQALNGSKSYHSR